MSKIIDISEHNGDIDFNKVKKASVEKVIIRLGWIGNKENHTIDKKFEEYYKQAKSVGLEIGFYVYSYCNNINSLKSGVNWIIKLLKGKTFNLPVFIDMEDPSIQNLNVENLTNQAKLFCDMIQTEGIEAGVYANKYWFLNKLDITKLLNYKIWLAEYNNNENHTLGYKVDLWQYSSKGRIDGINTYVDLNKCLCNQNEDKKESEDFQVKVYQNGSTKEIVYQDTSCTKQIGYLNPHETAECYGKINNLALIVYNIDKTNIKKTGFVKWLGGIL